MVSIVDRHSIIMGVGLEGIFLYGLKVVVRMKYFTAGHQWKKHYLQLMLVHDWNPMWRRNNISDGTWRKNI